MTILSVKETAKRLTCSISSVHRLIHNAGLPARRMGGRIIIIEEELESWLKNLEPAEHLGRSIKLLQSVEATHVRRSRSQYTV